MPRSSRGAAAAATFVASAMAAATLVAQFAPGFHPALPEPLLQLEPLATTPRSGDGPYDSPTEVHEVVLATQRGPVRARVSTPTGGADVAVVLVAGAGRADRYALSALADALAARNVAAVSYDKVRRGYSAVHRDFTALAQDAVDVVAATRTVTGARRVGLLGFSEGGWVAPLAVAVDPDIAFLILASAPVVTPAEQATWVLDRRLTSAPTWVRAVPAHAVTAGRGWVDYLDHDATGPLSAVVVPTLAVWGSEDAIVPVATAVRRSAEAAPASLVQMVLPGTGHALTGPHWPEVAVDWIHTGAPHPGARVGVDPVTHLGIGRPPAMRWYASPPAVLALATLSTVAASVHRHRRARVRRLTRKERHVHQ